MRSLSLLLCIPLLGSAVPGGAQDGGRASAVLKPLQDRARPLLIFGSASESRVEQQYRELTQNAEGLRDRQIVLILVTTATVPAQPAPPTGTLSPTQPQQAALRARFHVSPGAFTVLLIGKDGGEKYRSTRPVPFSTLAAVIDAMPMRRQEMNQH